MEGQALETGSKQEVTSTAGEGEWEGRGGVQAPEVGKMAGQTSGEGTGTGMGARCWGLALHSIPLLSLPQVRGVGGFKTTLYN